MTTTAAASAERRKVSRPSLLEAARRGYWYCGRCTAVDQVSETTDPHDASFVYRRCGRCGNVHLTWMRAVL